MGCLSGFLFIPTSRSARFFWLRTDQIRCNLSMITFRWFTRAILYANHMLVIFVALLWITPLAGIFINKGNGVVKSGFGNVEKLAGNVGCLLILVALGSGACWGLVPDLDYSRAKMFLHNRYLCLVVLQFLCPPVLALLFLGLSHIDDGVSFGILQC
ncbi:hypothetical protein JHK82_052790 [Glycine max]|nr:hypothetical protein JHK86_052643 [Glycine max]KAG4927008.1 hypothetical protein JHK85_053494 [Glycine max]KAG5082634.1 hypothetical protein JHK84_052672 [Glycine max]KAG5085393.1 hypothetical protein JHK82_052790 [Glycine max]